MLRRKEANLDFVADQVLDRDESRPQAECVPNWFLDHDLALVSNDAWHVVLPAKVIPRQ
jgi:hypothetical protein